MVDTMHALFDRLCARRYIYDGNILESEVHRRHYYLSFRSLWYQQMVPRTDASSNQVSVRGSLFSVNPILVLHREIS